MTAADLHDYNPYYGPVFMENLPGELRSILVENGDGPGPYGAKGIGESRLMPSVCVSRSCR